MSTRVRTNDIETAAVTAPKLAVLTAKGDLVGFDTAHNRLPIGADGQILIADSTQALGLKWGANTGGGGGINFVDNEVPAGSVNSTNALFTLAYTPVTNSVKLFKNGLRQSTSVDYTVVGSAITFVAGNIPQTGDILVADYRK